MIGEVQVYFAPLAAALPLVQQGRLRPLAVTTLKRLPALPEHPTVAELGYPGYEAGNWYGMVVPAKTPREAIATLRNGAVAALNNPAVARRMTDLGYVSIGDEPGEFAGFIKSEIEKLGGIIRELGVKAN